MLTTSRLLGVTPKRKALAIGIALTGIALLAIGFCKNSEFGDVEQIIYGLITLIGTLAWRAAYDRY